MTRFGIGLPLALAFSLLLHAISLANGGYGLMGVVVFGAYLITTLQPNERKWVRERWIVLTVIAIGSAIIGALVAAEWAMAGRFHHAALLVAVVGIFGGLLIGVVFFSILEASDGDTVLAEVDG